MNGQERVAVANWGSQHRAWMWQMFAMQPGLRTELLNRILFEDAAVAKELLGTAAAAEMIYHVADGVPIPDWKPWTPNAVEADGAVGEVEISMRELPPGVAAELRGLIASRTGGVIMVADASVTPPAPRDHAGGRILKRLNLTPDLGDWLGWKHYGQGAWGAAVLFAVLHAMRVI